MVPLVITITFLIAIVGFVLALVAVIGQGELKRQLSALMSRLRMIEGQSDKPRSEVQAPSPPPPPVMQVPVEPQPLAPPVAAPAPASMTDALIKEPSENLEFKFAKRWMTWVGALVLFISAALFLGHAFDNEWIGPRGQVILCALVGAFMLAAGSRFVKKGWGILGQGLMGLGLGILYATFSAAFSLYEPQVLTQTQAFSLMIAVTIAGVSMAVLHNAIAIAIIAVLGGLLTPVFLSTEVDSRDALFGYLLILNIGVLAVALFRRWRALDVLAMVGTYLLFAGWYEEFYDAASLGPAVAWLGGFYLIFLILPFINNLLRKTEIPIERFIMAVTNAAAAFIFAWLMLKDNYQHTLGFVAMGMAGAYLILGAIVRKRLPDDVRALFGMIAMTVTFLTLAIPIHFEGDGITFAWAIEGPLLLYLGYRYRYKPVRAFGAVLVGISIMRMFAVHFSAHQGLCTPFINRHFVSVMAAPLAACVLALIHRWFTAEGNLTDRVIKICSALLAGFLALIVFSCEIDNWLEHDYSSHLSSCAVMALWILAAGAYLWGGFKGRCNSSFGVGAFVLMISLIMGACLFENNIDRYPVINLRFVLCLAAVGTMLGYAITVRKSHSDDDEAKKTFADLFSWVGIVLLVALLSTEAYTYCEDTISDNLLAKRVGQMSITIVWGLCAASALFVGFWRRCRGTRLFALGLFGAAAVKLILVDLTFIRDIYRILSFLVLGILLIAGGYLYHKLEKRILAPDSPPTE